MNDKPSSLWLGKPLYILSKAYLWANGVQSQIINTRPLKNFSKNEQICTILYT